MPHCPPNLKTPQPPPLTHSLRHICIHTKVHTLDSDRSSNQNMKRMKNTDRHHIEKNGNTYHYQYFPSLVFTIQKEKTTTEKSSIFYFCEYKNFHFHFVLFYFRLWQLWFSVFISYGHLKCNCFYFSVLFLYTLCIFVYITHSLSISLCVCLCFHYRCIYDFVFVCSVRSYLIYISTCVS